MGLKKNIQSSIFAVLFGLTLLFPSVLQLAHTLEGHEHATCTNTATHIHEKNVDCSLCDFHFSSFHYDFTTFENFIVSEFFLKLQTGIISSEKNQISHSFYLRGPPCIS